MVDYVAHNLERLRKNQQPDAVIEMDDEHQDSDYNHDHNH